MHENSNDSELVEQLKSNDEAAFTHIYNKYWEKLFAIGFSYCRQKQIAEEMVQDVLMSLWDRRHTIAITNLSAYLATAIKFAVFKHLLKEKRRAELLEQGLSPVMYISEEEHINGRFLQDYINGVVETLPQQCRLVFRYSRNGELSIPEIAEKMQLSPKTVESHLTKALRILRLSLRGLRLWTMLAVLYLTLFAISVITS